jgi:tetratricopeptide (TPR) repeat protein/SAM-dependent methyltransferase
VNRSDRRRRRHSGAAAPSPAPAVPLGLREAAAAHNAGRLAEAESLYRRVLAQNPNHPDALHLCGMAGLQQGKGEDALDLVSRAIAAAPRNAAYHATLGRGLATLGRSREAVAAFDTALRISPGDAAVLNDRGTALRATGDTSAAIQSYRRAIAAAPGYATAHNNLGIALNDAGDSAGAIAALRRAASLDPKSAATAANLALALRAAGDLSGAIAAYRTTIALAPDRDDGWIGLADTLRFARIESPDPGLRDLVARCLEHPALDPQAMAAALIAVWRSDARFSAAVAAARNRGAVNPSDAAAVVADPVLRSALWRIVIPDPDIERLLVVLRGNLLDAVCAGDGLAPDTRAFLYALAAYAAETGYVFETSETEAAQVSALSHTVPDSASGQVRRERLAALACYRPIVDDPVVDDLFTGPDVAEAAGTPGGGNGADHRDDPFTELLDRLVTAPRAERAMAREIPDLAGAVACPGADPPDAASADPVSRAVRLQYEQHPYPRWRKVHRVPARPFGSLLRDLFPHHRPDPPPPERPDILIAGCGTGHTAAQTAQRFARARILAFDLSRASLAYAVRQSSALGISGIDFRHGDILEVDRLGRTFDYVECTGVLHHMRDPLAGWRALLAVLRPGGYMKIGLYSEAARRHVVAARAIAAGLGAAGLGAAPDGSAGVAPGMDLATIRRVRGAILSLPEGDPARAVSRGRDFYTAATFRDLVLHVQEHRFTLPAIATALADLGLELVGFEHRDPGAAAAYRARRPADPAMTDLATWHDVEAAAPATFLGMYMFWVRRPAG